MTPQRRTCCVSRYRNSWQQGRRNVWKDPDCRCRNCRPKGRRIALRKSEPKSSTLGGQREVLWLAALVVRLQFYAAPESGGRQPQHPSRSDQPHTPVP